MSFYQNPQYLFCQYVFFCVSPNNTLAHVSSYMIYYVDIGGSTHMTLAQSRVNTSLYPVADNNQYWSGDVMHYLTVIRQCPFCNI